MINAIMGGVLIGVAVSLMLLFNGRVTGISGIVSGIIKPTSGDFSWRSFFVLGLISGGFLLQYILPETIIQNYPLKWGDYIFAGILVGFGTLLGNGCTSGHGVCGISRFSVRSIMATCTFIIFGILSFVVLKALRGSI
jgi:uncharacterized membrane protein YedE/YeeE